MSTRERRLRMARKYRHQAAHIISLMETHQVSVSDVLEDPPRCLRRMQVYALLRRAPKLGDTGAEKVCQKANVWPIKRVGNLTQKEVASLISHLPPRAR